MGAKIQDRALQALDPGSLDRIRDACKDWVLKPIGLIEYGVKPGFEYWIAAGQLGRKPLESFKGQDHMAQGLLRLSRCEGLGFWGVNCPRGRLNRISEVSASPSTKAVNKLWMASS